MDKNADDSGTVITCKHIIEGNRPISHARRDEPAAPEDSGWQFLCELSHTESDGRIISVKEIVKIDPSINQIIELTGEASFVKTKTDNKWIEISNK